MTGVKICRICLNTNVKLYKYDCYYLKQYYEEVMAVNMNLQDRFPQYFCYECACMLHKFHKFREKCHSGQKALKDLLLKGPITLKSIANVDRESNRLKSSLDLIKVNKRVRTCLTKSKSISSDTKRSDTKIDTEEEIEQIKHPKVEKIEIDDSDDSSDNKNLADYKIDNIENRILKQYDANNDDEVMIDEDKQNEIDDDNIDDSRMSDDEKSNPEIINIATDENVFQETTNETIVAPKIKNTNKGDKSRNKKGNKLKKFEHKSKTYLDPEHWYKIILSEEEATEEFKARAQDPKYLAATYKCTECFKWFSKEEIFNRHMKLRHSESVGRIICRFCNMRFKQKHSLTHHITQHYTRFKCLRCKLTCPLETSAVFHNDYHNGVIRKCKHCEKEFRHLSTYYTHLRTHRSEHVCTLCGASFVSVIGLAIHKKIKHIDPNEVPQGEDKYCERCDIRFETLKAFDEHLIHSAKHVDGLVDSEGQLSAPSNPKKGRLKIINSKHKGYRQGIPTDCHVCGAHFATQAACRKHIMAEHPRTSFFAPNERQICEVCGMSLTPLSMQIHMNIHTREKLYPCQTCGRLFYSKAGVNKHQLTHSDFKPAACPLCDKRFKQTCSMQLHYRTFHLKEPYPKRNRKKKSDDIMSKPDNYEESDEDMPLDTWRSSKTK